MREQLSQLKDKFDQLSKRERYIIILMLLAVVFFIWDQLFYSPLNGKVAAASGQMETMHAQISVHSSEFASLASTLKDNPNRQLQHRIQAVENNVAKLHQKIGQLTADLIPPEQMTQVLEKVLNQNRGLKLIRVKSLPVEQIGLNEDSAREKGQADPDSGALYRHGVELELEGSFFQIIAYLKDLEKMPWRLVWSNLEYEVQQYPIAVVRLRIDTLSTDSGWIRV